MMNIFLRVTLISIPAQHYSSAVRVPLKIHDNMLSEIEEIFHVQVSMQYHPESDLPENNIHYNNKRTTD